SRRRRPAGERSRRAILDSAAQLATVEGLEGLSIGRLARAVGISKSGLYAHFRSKQELQLATIDTAGEIFDREVLTPGRDAAPGTVRVLALSDAFLSHVERGVFPGGCFFTSTSAEMNVRPGPVRDRIGEFVGSWLGTIEDAVREAQELGELVPDADAGQIAFEINALLVTANLAYLLFSAPPVLERARRGIRDRLQIAAAISA
ncbi:MAG TPA: TetR/AcrR family transcriptional regulator, partial [Solirubrobacteraceae bacterium]|nr:TetR/AcrR family transcriptional regulator [Solirubrobacteraceae bacterium]